MNRRREAGASYVEVLVAMALIAVALVPAVEALRGGVAGSEIGASRAALHFRVQGHMEDLLAQPFADLDAEAQAIGDRTLASPTYSDPVATPERRLVYLSRYDGDDVDPADGNPWTGTDEGLLWIRVEIEATNLAVERLRHDDR